MNWSNFAMKELCPMGGVVTALLMFTAPLQDMYEASTKAGHLGSLNPTPWIFMLGTCIGSIAYGFVIQDVYLLLGVLPGLLIAVWLNLEAIKLLYATQRTSIGHKLFVKTVRRQPAAALSENDSYRDIENGDNESTSTAATTITAGVDSHGDGQAVASCALHKVATAVTSPVQKHERMLFAVLTAWLAVVTVAAMGEHLSLPFVRNKKDRALLVGLALNLNTVFFYGAPLSTIYEVVRTKSSATIHLTTMMTNTLNGTFWCLYGIAIADPFVYLPNGVGAFFGVVQLFLCGVFPRQPADASSDVDHLHNADQQQANQVGELQHLMIPHTVVESERSNLTNYGS